MGSSGCELNDLLTEDAHLRRLSFRANSGLTKLRTRQAVQRPRRLDDKQFHFHISHLTSHQKYRVTEYRLVFQSQGIALNHYRRIDYRLLCHMVRGNKSKADI